MIELQLTVKALEDANFCKAWKSLGKSWKILDPTINVDQNMKYWFEAAGYLKRAANHPSMLYFVDTTFNEEKRFWVSAFLRGSSRTASRLLKGYLGYADIIQTVDWVAGEIDSAANSLLLKINEEAGRYYDEENSTEDQDKA